MVRPAYIDFACVASCVGVIIDLSGSEGNSYPFRSTYDMPVGCWAAGELLCFVCFVFGAFVCSGTVCRWSFLLNFWEHLFLWVCTGFGFASRLFANGNRCKDSGDGGTQDLGRNSFPLLFSVPRCSVPWVPPWPGIKHGDVDLVPCWLNLDRLPHPYIQQHVEISHPWMDPNLISSLFGLFAVKVENSSEVFRESAEAH